MKRVIEKEVSFCDNCNKEGFVQKCIGCDIEYCWDCEKIHFKKYNHGIHFSGSEDGYFCSKCDANPPDKVKKIHSLYQGVQRLRCEAEGFWKDFEKRQKEVEEELEIEYKRFKEEIDGSND